MTKMDFKGPASSSSSKIKEEEHCVECPVGLDDCVECGACDHCEHEAMLDESELPPNWLKFIRKSKTGN